MHSENWSRAMTTRTGFDFTVRPAQPSDEAALGDFFKHVALDDLRFRFLTALNEVSHSQLVAMTDFDHKLTENFLAFVDDGAEIIATAMLACDAAMQTGEVAISIRSDYKARGISWELLGHVAAYAEAKGLKTLQSIESRENHAAIDMERQMGFVAKSYPGDAALVLVEKQLRKP